MRTPFMLFAIACGMFAPEARAATPALVIEVLGTEPIGVRVFPSNAVTHCEGPGAIALVDTVVAPGKPLVVESDAQYFCIMRTFAPFTKVGWSNPLSAVHLEGTPPRRLSFLARIDGTPPKPAAPAPPAVTPLIVELTGDNPVGVRITSGTTTPCTSSDNQPLFSGVMKPSELRSIATTAACICVQQTTAPFVAVGWNEGTITCRPFRRVGKRLNVDFESPFRVSVSSKGP